MSSWYRLIRIVWYTHAKCFICACSVVVHFSYSRLYWWLSPLYLQVGTLFCTSRRGMDSYSRDLRCSVFSLLDLTLQGFYIFSRIIINRKFHFRLWRVAPINCRWGRYSTILDSVLITMVFTQHLLFARPFGLCRGVFGRSTSLRVLMGY